MRGPILGFAGVLMAVVEPVLLLASQSCEFVASPCNREAKELRFAWRSARAGCA